MLQEPGRCRLKIKWRFTSGVRQRPESDLFGNLAGHVYRVCYVLPFNRQRQSDGDVAVAISGAKHIKSSLRYSSECSGGLRRQRKNGSTSNGSVSTACASPFETANPGRAVEGSVHVDQGVGVRMRPVLTVEAEQDLLAAARAYAEYGSNPYVPPLDVVP
jgi:hypothetical protein